MATRWFTPTILAGLLLISSACGPGVDERWNGLQPKSSKAALVAGEADKLVIDWEASYDNRSKVAKAVTDLKLDPDKPDPSYA